MGRFVLIDTETNWDDKVMSIGAVMSDRSFQVLDSRYCILDPEYRREGMYSYVLRPNGTPQPIIASREEVIGQLKEWFAENQVDSIFAYNATFDKKHMPEFQCYEWYDIMRLAAYRQYNHRIPANALCCTTGRLKCNYGVESIYCMLSGDRRYSEWHNGWYDAVDELKVMEMLGQPLEMYRYARVK